jgi:phage head maturation protease
MTLAATFKYTFPIVKSEQRADGRYVIGYASGPEVDSEGERMAPEAIERFAAQINGEDSDELVYRDAHAPDGVLRDLGVIKKAWVNENMHLGIEVRLDDDNPASNYLWKQLDKGKQYGMSVSGRVLDYTYENVPGHTQPVRTYKNVVLDEISNTTRPAWYPSFGSVLAKSLKDASLDASEGVTEVKVGPNGELLDETVEDATKSDDSVAAGDEAVEDTDKSREDAYDASSAAYVAQSIIGLMAGEPGDAELKQAFDLIAGFMSRKVEAIGEDDTDKSESEDEAAEDQTEKSEDEAVESDEDVDKAGRSISATNGKKLLALYNEMATTLADLGLLGEGSEKSDSGDEEDTLDKSAEDTEGDGLAALTAQVEALAKTNAEQAARIEELEKAPRTQLPGAITDETRKSQESDLVDLLSKASPSDKLRLAFALQTQGK